MHAWLVASHSHPCIYKRGERKEPGNCFFSNGRTRIFTFGVWVWLIRSFYSLVEPRVRSKRVLPVKQAHSTARFPCAMSRIINAMSRPLQYQVLLTVSCSPHPPPLRVLLAPGLLQTYAAPFACGVHSKKRAKPCRVSPRLAGRLGLTSFCFVLFIFASFRFASPRLSLPGLVGPNTGLWPSLAPLLSPVTVTVSNALLSTQPQQPRAWPV